MWGEREKKRIAVKKKISCFKSYFWVPKERDFLSLIVGRYGFCIPQFCLICSLVFFYTNSPGVGRWLCSLALCVCEELSLCSEPGQEVQSCLGRCCRLCRHLRAHWKGKSGKTQQHLKWQLRRWFHSLFMVTFFVHLIFVLCSLSIPASSVRAPLKIWSTWALWVSSDLQH